MAERPKFFDDLAGMAGGAISALGGLRQEAESMVRSWIDDAIRRLDLIKREEFDAVQQMARRRVRGRRRRNSGWIRLSSGSRRWNRR